ncbi:hypothetical protein HW132_28865 [Brasilonema sp. CT11]|nr:hypothetical protein [Brasilonema sp. CT11]
MYHLLARASLKSGVKELTWKIKEHPPNPLQTVVELLSLKEDEIPLVKWEIQEDDNGMPVNWESWVNNSIT